MTDRIHCIIIDDEPLARKGLREYIADVDFLECIGEFEQPMKATATLSEGKVQLIFLDIQMPKITGLDFIRNMDSLPPVILSTAYPQYALEGFELNVLDYLVKPVSFDRFLKAAIKAKEYYEVRGSNAKEKERDYFFIKADNKLVKLFYHDILFVEALQNYVTIHTTGKKYITYLTFHSVEEYLPAGQFIRCHKSFIVAAAKIDSIEGNCFQAGGHSIPISRNYKEEVMDKLVNGKFLKR